MPYIPFILMNVVILAMVAHVFLKALADSRGQLQGARSRRLVHRR